MSQTLQFDNPELLDQQGYLVVEDVLDPDTVIDPVLDSFAENIAEYAYRTLGRRSFASKDLSGQLISLFSDGQDWLTTGFDIALPPGGPYLEGVPLFLERQVFDLIADDRLLDVIERVLGPDIWLNPTGHTRMKIPRRLAPEGNSRIGDTEWHQDGGVVLEEADGAEMLTVWIPLTDAPVERGCLRVHAATKDGELLEHCPGSITHIPDAKLPATGERALPMRRGSVLLMWPRTPHASLPNVTDGDVRISLDLRYQPVAAPNGRPWMPSFLLRGSDPQGTPVATYETWRQGWLRTQAELVARTAGEKLKANRWSATADACA